MMTTPRLSLAAPRARQAVPSPSKRPRSVPTHGKIRSLSRPTKGVEMIEPMPQMAKRPMMKVLY